MNDAAILRVQGEIDLAAAPALRQTLTNLTASRKHVVVDFSAVAYFDGSGVRVLEEVQALCAHQGRTLVVAAVPPVVRRVFEIAGLPQRVRTEETIETALRFLDQ